MDAQRRKFPAVILLLVSLLISFFIGEAVCRSVSRRKPALFSAVGYGEMRHPYAAFQANIPFEDARRRDPQEFIVAVLGGSTAWGYGADLPEKSVCRMLEKDLNERNPSHEKISRFRVVCMASPDYHSTQEKTVLTQALFIKCDIDLVVSLSGPNNLAKPLENSVYGLPLNYPGWRWVLENHYEPRTKYFFAHFLQSASGKSYFLRLMSRPLTRHFLNSYYLGARAELNQRVSAIAPAEKQRLMAEGIRMYKQDAAQMDSLARANGIKTLFVLEPLLGLSKKPTEKENQLLSSRTDVGLSEMSHDLWLDGYEGLKRVGAELRADKIDFWDATAIYQHEARQTFADLAHLNNLGHEILADRIAEQVLRKLR